MLDMGQTTRLLSDVIERLDELDGLDYDDPIIRSATKAERREARVEIGRTLQMISHRLRLASELVMVEYYIARGEDDPLGSEEI